MKSLGIVRKIDPLGRIVLPKELRNKDVMDLPENTPMEIFTDGDAIVLKKYNPSCIFCGQAKDVTAFKGKNVCKNCRSDIRVR